MPLPIKLIAAVTTTTAAASTAAYIAINSYNAGPSSSSNETAESRPANDGPSTGVPDEGDDLTMCVGGDRILRVPPGFAPECPEGQMEFELEETDEQLCELCDPFEDPPDEPESDDKAVADLERRIRSLEKTAYFEVITQDERPIFEVVPGGVLMRNPQERTVATVGTSDTGGHFTGRSSAGVEAILSASGTNAGVLIGDAYSNRIELGSRNAGGFALRFPSGNGLIAGIGQSRAGTGVVLVGTLPGVTQGSITVTDGRGMFSLTKDGRPGGLAIAEATIGGGLLDIGNNAGNSAVKMGHNGDRYGIVMAGPIMGFPYVPRSGLPGSYFMGCASGERPACTPTVP